MTTSAQILAFLSAGNVKLDTSEAPSGEKSAGDVAGANAAALLAVVPALRLQVFGPRPVISSRSPLNGWKWNRTCSPGGTSTARKITLARRIGAGRPSTSARHQGCQVVQHHPAALAGGRLHEDLRVLVAENARAPRRLRRGVARALEQHRCGIGRGPSARPEHRRNRRGAPGWRTARAAARADSRKDTPPWCGRLRSGRRAAASHPLSGRHAGRDQAQAEHVGHRRMVARKQRREQALLGNGDMVLAPVACAKERSRSGL